MEDRWIQFGQLQKRFWEVQKSLAKFERFKDVDPRACLHSFHEGAWLKGSYRLIKLIAKEILYEVHRHTIGRHRVLDRPIFVIGIPHSGTSIAMKMLARHPEITNASELNTYWHPGDYFDVQHCDHEKTASDCNPREKRRIQSRLEFERWLRGNRPRFLNKNPINTVAVEYLRACFPDCFIVHVVRDGRAVVNSLMHSLPDPVETYDRYKKPHERVSPWAGVRPPNWRQHLHDDPLIQHAVQWKLCVEYVLEREQQLLPNFWQLKYEDLCADTRKTVAEIWEVASLVVNDETLQDIPEHLASQNYKYKDVFSADVLDKINEIMHDTLDTLGYV